MNLYGVIVLDTFVAQRERIGDWRTWVSGVRPEDVKDGEESQLLDVRSSADAASTLYQSTLIQESSAASGRYS